MARYSRGPGLFGGLFGITWIVISIALFGSMLYGYSRILGMPGTLFGIFLPLSAPLFPFLHWYFTGAFPWLWAVGFLVAIVMGKMALTD